MNARRSKPGPPERPGALAKKDHVDPKPPGGSGSTIENSRETMPFKKGQSGNPGGRRKMAQEIRDLACAACPKAIQTLIAQLDHPDPRIAANAADKLLDRGSRS
ncbi:MAG TPA: DUF5681 domain-containing protein [Geminicoccaceae bacterium]